MRHIHFGSQLTHLEESTKTNRPLNRTLVKLKEEKIDNKYIENLSEDLAKRTVDSKFKKEYTKAVERLKPVEKTQYLLGHVYHVSWILI